MTMNGNGKNHGSFSEKKLKTVSNLIKALWPNSVFALCLWNRPTENSPCDVLYVSNCEEDEQASLLFEAAKKLQENLNFNSFMGHA